ncbi:MAG: hypothetical protein ACK4E8_10735 [Lacibacter sp.]
MRLRTHIQALLPAQLLVVYFIAGNWLRHGHLFEISELRYWIAFWLILPTIIYIVFLRIFKKSYAAGLALIPTIAFLFFLVPVHNTFREWHVYRKWMIFPVVFLITGSALMGYLIRIRKKQLALTGATTRLFALMVLFMLGSDVVARINYLERMNFSLHEIPELHSEANKLNPDSLPNILYVVFDMHGSTRALQQQIGYDNSALDSQLTKAGFKIWPNASSPTNFTPATLTSIFNLAYPKAANEITTTNTLAFYEALYLLQHNIFIPFLHGNHYASVNAGLFAIEKNDKSYFKHPFTWGTPEVVVTNQFLPNFLFHTYRWAWSKLLPQFIKPVPNLWHATDIKMTRLVLEKLEHSIRDTTHQPKFIYGHFLLPHEPFKFDSTGNTIPYTKKMYYDGTLNHYYAAQVAYCRNIMQQLTEETIGKNPQKWIVIFQGDHSLRRPELNLPDPLSFQVLHAVYEPGNKDTLILTEPFSTVNTFRYVLNKYFKTQLPLLPVKTFQYNLLPE